NRRPLVRGRGAGLLDFGARYAWVRRDPNSVRKHQGEREEAVQRRALAFLKGGHLGAGRSGADDHRTDVFAAVVIWDRGHGDAAREARGEGEETPHGRAVVLEDRDLRPTSLPGPCNDGHVIAVYDGAQCHEDAPPETARVSQKHGGQRAVRAEYGDHGL